MLAEFHSASSEGSRRKKERKMDRIAVKPKSADKTYMSGGVIKLV